MSEKSPDAYRTISEAGEEAGLPPHVLRFWESKFAQLKPIKRAGGRRMYRPQDISLLKGLRRLLYEDGYTIKGAQKYLREHGVGVVSALGDSSKSDSQYTPPVKQAAASQDEGDGSIVPAPALESAASTELSEQHKAAAKRALMRLEAARLRLKSVLSKR